MEIQKIESAIKALEETDASFIALFIKHESDPAHLKKSILYRLDTKLLCAKEEFEKL